MDAAAPAKELTSITQRQAARRDWTVESHPSPNPRGAVLNDQRPDARTLAEADSCRGSPGARERSSAGSVRSVARRTDPRCVRVLSAGSAPPADADAGCPKPHFGITKKTLCLVEEALGGPRPATFSAACGDETSVVRLHKGNGPHEETDRRATSCFDQALDDVGLAGDDLLRHVLHDYFTWATTRIVAAKANRGEADGAAGSY